MGEDTALIEQRIVEQRLELDATVAAIVYQADLRHRLPEYAEDIAESILNVGQRRATVFALNVTRVIRSNVLVLLPLVSVSLGIAFMIIRSARRIG